MTAHVISACGAQPHIRPFRPARDMAALADLIEAGFGTELVLTGSMMVRDMRQIARWGPLLHLGRLVLPLFTGFVWVEDRRIVGNITVSPRDDGRIWTISNVTVSPEHRRLGIAGHLVDCAVAHVRQRGGRRILLQVRSGNVPARTLYEHRRFVRYDSVHELDLRSVRWPATVGGLAEGLRGTRASDGAALYRVVLGGTKPESLAARPASARAYERGAVWRLRQYSQLVLGARMRLELVAAEDGRVVAFAGMNAYLLGGCYELELWALKEHHGRWERPLLSGVLDSAAGIPHQTVRMYASDWHPELLEAAHEMGFETLRVLDQMALEL